jgi:hypothetical protein
MSEAEKTYAKSLEWILFEGDFRLTEAMNEVFHKTWIRECDTDHFFEVPENQLTEIGQLVIRRLIFAKDVLGIELNYEIFVQIYQRSKAENPTQAQNEQKLRNFELQEALQTENYEKAQALMGSQAFVKLGTE